MVVDGITQGEVQCCAFCQGTVAQELVAHGFEPYYYNSKKRGEIDFVIENNGKVLPIEAR